SEPPVLFLYFLGCLGLGAMFYIYFLLPSQGTVSAGALHKLIHGFVPFAYAPFLALFAQLYNSRTNYREQLPWLLLFACMLVLVSVGRNSRSAFMEAVLLLGLAYG